MKREVILAGTDSTAFFLLVESIIEIGGIKIQSKFLLREDYSCKWTTDFLASGNHSL